MSADSALGSISGFLRLGFPVGLLAPLGIFCIGLAAYRNDISLDSKLLFFGVFSFCIGSFMYYLERIVEWAGYTESGKTLRRYKFGALLGAVVCALGSFYSGKVLWHLLHAVANAPTK